MGYVLGIDLGTTSTAAAECVDGRLRVVRLGAQRSVLPSLVFVDAAGTTLVGEAAERRGAAEPGRLAREVKRRIGDPVPVLVGGSPYPAHGLLARLLGEVLRLAVGDRGAPDAVTVTHPANWGPYKRELFAQAVHLADAAAVTLRVEPEAAAVRHAAEHRLRPGELVAVYDLGGGTFDAAVLSRTAAGFTVLGEPEGVEQLGGADFDEAVFAHVLGTLGERAAGLDPADADVTASLARLRRDCLEAKEALSFDTDVLIPVALPGLHTRVRLNRSEFEAMIGPAVSETIAALRRALRSAGVEPGDLSGVLLAGGSSRIPLVAERVAAEFGRPVLHDPDPEHSVALGAALLAAPDPAPVPPAAPAPAHTTTVPPAAPVPAHTAPVPVSPGPAPEPVAEIADTDPPLPASAPLDTLLQRAGETTVLPAGASRTGSRRRRLAVLAAVAAVLLAAGAVVAAVAAVVYRGSGGATRDTAQATGPDGNPAGGGDGVTGRSPTDASTRAATTTPTRAADADGAETGGPVDEPDRTRHTPTPAATPTTPTKPSPPTVTAVVSALDDTYTGPCPPPDDATTYQVVISVSSGPVTVRFRWTTSNGADSDPSEQVINFNGAGPQNRTIRHHEHGYLPGQTTTDWVAVELHAPVYRLSNKAGRTLTCTT